MRFHKIVGIGVLNLEDGVKKKLQDFSEKPIRYWENDTLSPGEIIEKIRDADAILASWRTTISNQIMEEAKYLRYIGICGTTMAGIDGDAAKQKGITVTNVTHYGDIGPAEYIFGQLLSLIRGFGKYQWKSQPTELYGKTIGIVGLGAVGGEVARLALGFQMKVLYFSLSRKKDWEKKGLLYKSLETLIKESDIVTIHVPKNTIVLTKKEFDLLTPGKILVITSLGKLFQEQDFINWIKDSKNFAIFDYSVSTDLYDKLKDMKNVIFPKIVAGITAESKERLGRKVIQNIKDYLLKYPINSDA